MPSFTILLIFSVWGRGSFLLQLGAGLVKVFWCVTPFHSTEISGEYLSKVICLGSPGADGVLSLLPHCPTFPSLPPPAALLHLAS